jgi:hypothetical protein
MYVSDKDGNKDKNEKNNYAKNNIVQSVYSKNKGEKRDREKGEEMERDLEDEKLIYQFKKEGRGNMQRPIQVTDEEASNRKVKWVKYHGDDRWTKYDGDAAMDDHDFDEKTIVRHERPAPIQCTNGVEAHFNEKKRNDYIDPADDSDDYYGYQKNPQVNAKQDPLHGGGGKLGKNEKTYPEETTRAYMQRRWRRREP